MKIKIKTLVEYQLYMVMIVEMLISLIHIPTASRYILDINIIFLMFISVCNRKKTPIISKEYIFIKHYIIIYMFICVMGAIFMSVPIGQILWAVRNNYFYVFYFFICIIYLEKNDADRIMERLVGLQILNVIVASYEYFILHVKNDYLGGIFGTMQGCNGYLNVYCVVICAYILSKYLNGKTSLTKLLWVMGSSLFLTAMSELKFFYIELVVIIIFAVLLNANFIKGIVVIVSCGAGLMIGLNLLASVNAESMKYLSSLEAFIEYGSRSEFGQGDVRIARFTAVSQVNDLFFKNNIWNKLFGYGLGACEESSTFSFCNSSFADKYGTLGYRNLTSSMNYLETGLIGIIMFILFFVLIFVIVQKTKKYFHEDKYIGTYVQIVSVLTILICFYNSAIRREIAYLSFFVFAYYFISLREVRIGANRYD